MKIGINGFGRIGRLVLRSALERGVDLEIVAINDRGGAKINAHLFQFDSTYGPFRGEVEAESDHIRINGRPIAIVSHLNPLDIPWRDLGVNLVIESTGAFTTGEQSGAERVLVSAPCKGGDVTIVAGVNENDYQPTKHQIISAASCTTNGLAPVAKVLHEQFGISHGTMSTIHAYTNDQRILDRSHVDPRRARAAAENIIPTTTGATKALGEVIPALQGKLHGVSYRVPLIAVSVIDLTVELQKEVTVAGINAAFSAAAVGRLNGILGYNDLPLVSSDFRKNSHSSIVDGLMTAVIPDEQMVRVVCWYDNEWGYASRVVDVASYISDCGQDAVRPVQVRVVRRDQVEQALHSLWL